MEMERFLRNLGELEKRERERGGGTYTLSHMT
jgi:hypothetical protein